MGQELKCIVEHAGRKAEGKALLETDEVLFRGDFSLRIAFKAIQKTAAHDGKLVLTWAEGEATFHLGDKAPKWADKILHPPTRLDKLGIRAGTRYRVVGSADAEFSRELEESGAEKVRSNAEIVFLIADTKANLARLAAIREDVVWIVYPKGLKTITENDVRTTGLGAGLRDTKVARFSATHTALRFNRPVRRG
jgi:hypothetical protein